MQTSRKTHGWNSASEVATLTQNLLPLTYSVLQNTHLPRPNLPMNDDIAEKQNLRIHLPISHHLTLMMMTAPLPLPLVMKAPTSPMIDRNDHLCTCLILTSMAGALSTKYKSFITCCIVIGLTLYL